MKKVATSALALSLIFGASNGVVNASELNPNSIQEQTEISQEEISELKSFLSSYDVNQDIQNNLIEKLNAGEIWDSLKKGEKAVHSYEVQSGETVEKVDQYKDGSIVVTSVDYESVEEVKGITPSEVNPGITPLGVDPGTVTSGTGYKNFKKARVYYNTGIANAHFYANFTIVQGGNDYISSVYDQKVTALGGTASDISLKLTKAKETLDGKASAKLSFNYSNFNNTGSTTCWLKLSVGKDTYSETHSF